MKKWDYEESFSTDMDISALLMDRPQYYNPDFIWKPRTKQAGPVKKAPLKPVTKGRQIQNSYNSGQGVKSSSVVWPKKEQWILSQH